MLQPDAGTIAYDGQDITRLSAGAAQRAGDRPFVPDSAAVRGHDGLRERLRRRRVRRSCDGGQAGYDRLPRRSRSPDSPHLANVPAGRLRLLDRKRLELARALATRPQLILLDEIAGGLTEKELPPLIEMIRGLRDAGITVIWIEHIVHALLEVVDQLMCLAFGRILAIGDPHEVMGAARRSSRSTSGPRSSWATAS